MVEILQKEARMLRVQTASVNPKDFNSPGLKKIITTMKIALEKEADGVAIAAPQIGIPLRIFIVSHRAFEIENKHENIISETSTSRQNNISQVIPQNQKKNGFDIVFINPEITKLSRKKVWMPEGCLSVRWLYGEVSRANKATVRAYDEHGKLFTRGASGLLAQIFQHETDHLNGVLFIDTARNLETITAEDQERMHNERTHDHDHG